MEPSLCRFDKPSVCGTLNRAVRCAAHVASVALLLPLFGCEPPTGEDLRFIDVDGGEVQGIEQANTISRGKAATRFGVTGTDLAF